MRLTLSGAIQPEDVEVGVSVLIAVSEQSTEGSEVVFECGAGLLVRYCTDTGAQAVGADAVHRKKVLRRRACDRC
eukprot:664430-Rhodomonas_salina.3